MQETLAYCLIKVQPNAGIDTVKSLSSSHLVNKIDIVLGRYDLVAKLDSGQREDIREFLKFAANTCEGIEKTSTHTSLERFGQDSEKVDGYVFAKTPTESLDLRSIVPLNGLVEAHILLGEYDAVCEVKAENENPIRTLARVSAILRDQTIRIETETFIVIHESDLPNLI